MKIEKNLKGQKNNIVIVSEDITDLQLLVLVQLSLIL